MINLHAVRAWEQPLFFRRMVVPALPFVAAAIVFIAYGVTTDIQAHQVLDDLQAQIPKTNLAKLQADQLNKYNTYRDLLVTLYDTRATTLAGLHAISNISSIRPKTMRLSTVTLLDPRGTQVNLSADVTDAQRDVNTFITNATKRGWQFHLNSLTSPANGTYLVQGILTIVSTPEAATPPAANAPRPPTRKTIERLNHPPTHAAPTQPRTTPIHRL